MDSFTVREGRSALPESVDERAQTNQRESARDVFAPRRGEIGSQIQQLRDAVVATIDAVITELRHRREVIVEESMRMHREIVAYTKLNQAANGLDAGHQRKLGQFGRGGGCAGDDRNGRRAYRRMARR